MRYPMRRKDTCIFSEGCASWSLYALKNQLCGEGIHVSFLRILLLSFRSLPFVFSEGCASSMRSLAAHRITHRITTVIFSENVSLLRKDKRSYPLCEACISSSHRKRKYMYFLFLCGEKIQGRDNGCEGIAPFVFSAHRIMAHRVVFLSLVSFLRIG